MFEGTNGVIMIMKFEWNSLHDSDNEKNDNHNDDADHDDNDDSDDAYSNSHNSLPYYKT